MACTTSQVSIAYHQPPTMSDNSPSMFSHLLDFLDEHPGGPKILKRMAGKDSSKQFWKYHNEKVLEKYGDKLKVGTVKEQAKL